MRSGREISIDGHGLPGRPAGWLTEVGVAGLFGPASESLLLFEKRPGLDDFMKGLPFWSREERVWLRGRAESRWGLGVSESSKSLALELSIWLEYDRSNGNGISVFELVGLMEWAETGEDEFEIDPDLDGGRSISNSDFESLSLKNNLDTVLFLSFNKEDLFRCVCGKLLRD